MLRLAEPQKLTPMRGERNYLVYIPLGVGVVIPPWNFPCAIMAGIVVASLVTGNTVVVKPAGDSPTIAAKFVDILFEAGIPKEAVNFHHRPRQRHRRRARPASEDALHRLHRLEGSRSAHQRTRRQSRSRPDLDQAHRARNGRQGRHRRRRRSRYRRRGRRHRASRVRLSGTEVLGLLARHRFRKSLRHVRCRNLSSAPRKSPSAPAKIPTTTWARSSASPP